VLLLIHGTFSNCENFAGALNGVPDTDGKTFLEWARGKYDAILAFNHPTLSLPPLLNALRLESLLGDLPGKIDVVCHSRGGIVARWWYEVACRRPERLGKVVFAGSPLAGTSLAAPDKVRDAIEYFTNVGRVLKYGLGAGSLFFPFLSVAQGLMSLVCSATSFLASVPVADAVIGLVPGFTAQSRVANNLELVELRQRARPMPQYYAITSDFRPTDPGWYFWRHFTRLNAASLAAGLIFPKPHDLVVDHEAMTELGRTPQGKEVQIPAAHRLDYGRNGKIHHVNYFSDLKSVQFLKKSLA
jgi:pimeloyl-ACP methyl ester carboxylesterase